MTETLKNYGVRAIEFTKKWYMLTSALALAALIFIVNRKSQTITQLQDTVLALKVVTKLKEFQTKAEQDEKSYYEAAKSYSDFKRIHSDLFKRLGVGERSTTNPGGDSDSGGVA